MKRILALFILIFCLFNLQYTSFSKENRVIKSTTPLSIEILDAMDVYPNPANEHVYVKLNTNSTIDNLKIEVMSFIGSKMNASHEKVENGLYKIDLTDIPSGHYYIMVTIDTEKKLKKFIKQ